MERQPDPLLLSSDVLHSGRIFRVLRQRVQLPSGLIQDLDLVDHPGAVAIAALEEDGRLLLVRQYRHAARSHLVEIPAGRLEPGEEPLQAARRELEEETGQRAARWSELCRFFPAPGFCSEQLTLFLAKELGPVSGARRPMDEDEELELVRLTPAEVLSSARDAKTLLAALLIAAGQRRPP